MPAFIWAALNILRVCVTTLFHRVWNRVCFSVVFSPEIPLNLAENVKNYSYKA